MKYRRLLPLFFAAAQGAMLAGCGNSLDSGQVSFANPQVQQPAVNPPAPLEPQLTEFSASGTGVQAAVDQFRQTLGATNNGAGLPAKEGRREVNWDGVPANQTNTDSFPGDFFNVNSTRGLLVSTPGTGLRTSNNNFSDIDASYSTQFSNFSPVKTFASIVSVQGGGTIFCGS